MRIIGGTYGGRVLRVPKGLPVRPTTDRTKEALFNILGHRLHWPETRVLDLFTGTGGISLECWSRGAAEVWSVDKHGRCISALKQNLSILGLPTKQLYKADAFRFAETTPEQFDFIFLDPPYALSGQEVLVSLLLTRPVLLPGGLLVAEHAPQLQFDHLPGFEQKRVYGSSCLSFFSSGGASDQ